MPAIGWFVSNHGDSMARVTKPLWGCENGSDGSGKLNAIIGEKLVQLRESDQTGELRRNHMIYESPSAMRASAARSSNNTIITQSLQEIRNLSNNLVHTVSVKASITFKLSVGWNEMKIDSASKKRNNLREISSKLVLSRECFGDCRERRVNNRRE